MQWLEYATWALVVATIILAGGALYHACITKKSSKNEVNALSKLTKAILHLPSIAKHIRTQEELAEQRKKEQEKVQKKALTG